MSNMPVMPPQVGFSLVPLLLGLLVGTEAIPAGIVSRIAQTPAPEVFPETTLDATPELPSESSLDLPPDLPPDDPQAQASVSGAVVSLQRSALPPNTMLSVQLLDLTRASASTVVLAEQTIRTNGRQMPLNFEILYDPALIQDNHRYAVRARVLINGAIALTSPQTYPVITGGNPSRVEVRVEPVR
ncbi:YbaY family lipoprotein [Thermoleptolyngbya sp. C42_A2020_037]|uniref:YbaY family lipoprotein n=1 Tax=Thermoleptolyngbya sp. C42_A2020_037 TaxID=2747799 RepID=UPI0019D9C5E4|nr:YbaY family lipoprotein [Thermoleptolyngbya sp. C42_A2020_037]MBF2083338.1 YbaY family lipoprotein [Thermoleptolyngbya sp. C42_A2020_037]